MRELLVESVLEDTSPIHAVSATFLAVVVFAAVAAPTLLVCGACFSSGKPSAPAQPTTEPSVPPPPTKNDAEALLEPRDASLEATEKMLHDICNVMKGSVMQGKTIVKGSIRTGINAVIVDTVPNFTMEETILFFPNPNYMTRQMRLYTSLNLKDFMPLTSMDTQPYQHQSHGHTAQMPAALIMDRAKTLDSVVRGFKTIQEKQQELFGIWAELARLLKTFHQRGWFLRDVTYSNVVMVRTGVKESWTLLEFGNASKEKKSVSKQTIPPRTVPPEMCKAMFENPEEKVHLNPAYDMWQLGILVYEVFTGEAYWPQRMRDAEVLRAMADPLSLLPHEARPINVEVVQKVMAGLMARNPEERFTATELLRRIEEDLPMQQTLYPGVARPQEEVVLPS